MCTLEKVSELVIMPAMGLKFTNCLVTLMQGNILSLKEINGWNGLPGDIINFFLFKKKLT